jgi:hypothetical protein
MVKVWLAVALGAMAFGNTISYNYTGNGFTRCVSGPTPCPSPSIYGNDHNVATIDFSAPLPANLSSVNPTSLPTFLGWTIGDVLGYVFFSSANPSTSQFAFFPFSLTTDATGAITAWSMSLKSNPYIPGTVAAQYISIVSPAFIGGGSGLPDADDLSVNGGPDPRTGGWNFGNGNPGTWTETVSSNPEPSSFVLLFIALGMIVALHRRKAQRNIPDLTIDTLRS